MMLLLLQDPVPAMAGSAMPSSEHRALRTALLGKLRALRPAAHPRQLQTGAFSAQRSCACPVPGIIPYYPGKEGAHGIPSLWW